MRNATRQSWTQGAKVKVGFLTLRVLAHQCPDAGRPGAYTLASVDGTKLYSFTPYSGLERI